MSRVIERTTRVAITTVLAIFAGRSLAHAQGASECRVTSDRLSYDSTAAGRFTAVAGNVVIRCPARGITVRGDSAEQYPDHDFVIGHAVYDEPRVHITSDYLNWFPNDEIARAVGHVDARMPSGSRLVGPIAEYYRPGRLRKQSLVTARARPTITIVEKDSSGRVSDPTTVLADSLRMENDSLVYARGQVQITRPNISATADSAFIDEGREIMQLRINPVLNGKRDHPFTLTGGAIDLFSRNRKLTRVLSKANATAVSDSMTLKSDTIDLRVQNDVLDHAYAWGAKGRAHVNSPSQNLVADSLDVAMPNQRISLVRALRSAYAEGRPDTTRFRLEKTDPVDWLKGDTIVAHFDTTPAPPHDTSKGPAIKQLVAAGHASSVFHMAASDTAERRPAINYVAARVISVNFDQKRVSTVTTLDSVYGVFIEPKADTTAKRRPAAQATPATSPRTSPAAPPRRPPTGRPPVDPLDAKKP